MILRETPRARPGFGAPRFLVNPNRVLTAEQSKALYTRVAEIPQRVPLVPGFPAPGRRGPSRPRAEQPPPGQPPTPGAPPTGAPGEPPPTTGPPTYPEPRDPRDPGAITPNPNLPTPGQPTATATRTCTGPGGMHMQVAATVAAGATDVQASQRIDRPYVIRHTEVFATNPATAPANFLIKIANDNNTAGGTGTTGTPLDEQGFGGNDFVSAGNVLRSFPNKVVTTVPTFIKTVITNTDAAARFACATIDIEFLD